MSTDTLHQIAQNDTPAAVHVPPTTNGLIVWAIGRFGGIVVATFLASAAAWTLYGDHKAQNERMFQILERKLESDIRLADAISKMTQAVNELGVEARSAHRVPK